MERDRSRSLPRVAVIGAGIVGAAVAHELTDQGAETVLLDRAEPGSEATAASYAWVNANEKLPRAYFALSAAAMAEHRRLAARLAPATWYHADGNLVWSADAPYASALGERVQRLAAWGYAARLLTARVVLADLEPGLAIPNAGTPVAWFPDEAWIDAPAMTRHLIEEVRRKGGLALTGAEHEVVAIGHDGDRVSTVTLANGQSLAIDAVVNAAGVAADRIAAMVGRELPLAPRPGVLVRAEMPDGSDPLRRPIETDDVAVRPDGPGRVALIPGDDTRPEWSAYTPGPIPLDDPLVPETMAAGAAVVPALAKARPVSARVAVRPIPADGFPSVGAVAAIPGYFEAVMHSGVTLAALVSRSLAAEVLGVPGNPLLDPFRPDRFAAPAPVASQEVGIP